MSSEPPPNPITNSFNVRAWIQSVAGLTFAEASLNFISKRIADTCAGIITFTNGIILNSIDSLTPTGFFTIATAQSSGHLLIANNVLRTGAICIGAKVFIPTINTITIGNVSTAISYLRGVIVNIADTGGVTNVNIGASSTDIKIGTSQVSTNTIGIGGSGSIIAIPGATTIGSINCAAINSTSAGTNMNIASTSTANVTLATSSGRTGTLNLGDGNNSTGAVHINNGVSSSGNVRIMNGSSQSGELTLGGSNSVVIAVNRPLTPGYTYSATAPIGSTGIGKIGQIISSTFAAQTIFSGTKNVIGELSLTQGIWLLTANFGVSLPSGSASFAQTAWYLGATQYAITDYASYTINPRQYSGNTTIYVPTNNVYQMKLEIYFTGATGTSVSTGYNISALRLA